MPSTRTSRATSFGYGQKDIGLKNDKFVAPVGTYDLGTEFKKDESKGFSFGSGREVVFELSRKWSLPAHSRIQRYKASSQGRANMIQTNQCSIIGPLL
jgi:hypothetical protein